MRLLFLVFKWTLLGLRLWTQTWDISENNWRIRKDLLPIAISVPTIICSNTLLTDNMAFSWFARMQRILGTTCSLMQFLLQKMFEYSMSIDNFAISAFVHIRSLQSHGLWDFLCAPEHFNMNFLKLFQCLAVTRNKWRLSSFLIL